MHQCIIKFAGIPLSANLIYESNKKRFQDYFTDDVPLFSVTSSQNLIEEERISMNKAAEKEGYDPKLITDEMLEMTGIHRLISEEFLLRDVLLMHGSAVAVDGEVYIFTAPSGTGKSTHARLWREYFGSRAVMVNDDKPFLSVKDDKVYVCGSVWNGKHHLGENITRPLKAICILDRAKENSIQEITPMEAFFVLFKQCFHSEEAEREKKVLEMLDMILKNVKIYHLHCNMNLDAARISYEGMNNEI